MPTEGARDDDRTDRLIAIPMVRFQAPVIHALLCPATDPEPKRLHALNGRFPVWSPNGRSISAGTDDAHGVNMSRVTGKSLSLR